MGTDLTCRACGEPLPGGVESCLRCHAPVLPGISALTWTTPRTETPFEGRCPWCGTVTQARGTGLAYECPCPCGAIAFGLPPWDYDEVIDAAIAHFGLDPSFVVNRAHDPARWLESFGIEFREGGREKWVVADHALMPESVARIECPGRPTEARGQVFWYWFKSVGRPQ